MKRICINCHFVGEIEKVRTHNYKFPLAGFLLGIGATGLFSDHSSPDIYVLISIVMTLFFILFGLFLLFKYFNPKNKQTEGQTSFTFLVLGVVLAVWGLLSFLGSILSAKSLPSVGPLVWLIFGAATIYFYYNDSEQCVNCNKKGTMVPLDTPSAQQLIKENNLSVPE